METTGTSRSRAAAPPLLALARELLELRLEARTRSCARRADLELRLAGAAPADAAGEARERVVLLRPRRGSVYLSCASSTWSLPSRLSARCAKMSRMSCVRSITLRSVASSMARACAGVRSRSKMATVARLAWPEHDLVELALAQHGARMDLRALLAHRVGHLDPGRAHQLQHLLEVLVLSRDADHQRPLLRRLAGRALTRANSSSRARIVASGSKLS